ncbi:MAG: hypothetical protein AMXMBFR84_47790 [Candidatus Hydrogenedentota bacterium]
MSLFKSLFKGSGHGVDELARRMGMSTQELTALVPTYSSFSIPKRSGGQRKILAPDPDLKRVQRLVLRRLLARLRSHPHAVGFEHGHSIVTNAACHVNQAVVAKLDIVDFFSSTTAKRIEKYFQFIGWNREAAALLTKLCTHEGALPQGAPTSPRLSNLVNFGLDAGLTALAAQASATYTRYADDITFSFPKDDIDSIKLVLNTARLSLVEAGYKVHVRKKRKVLRRHQRQQVTGLVVNQKVQLPRKTRRWLRAVRYRAVNGAEATLSPAQIAGWDALERMISSQRG